MNETIVITHSADFDGIFCREIARKFLPDAIHFGWDFPDKPMKLPTLGTKIYIMDLPVDRVFGVDYRKGAYLDRQHLPNITWIDHHASSIESHPPDIRGYRIDGVAACRLAWQWFQQGHHRLDAVAQLPTKEDFINREVSEPLAVRLAGEYDVWDRRDSNAELFQFGLKTVDLFVNAWERLLASPREESSIMMDVMIRNGMVAKSFFNKENAITMKRSFMTEFEGLQFLCINSARFDSQLFASRDVPETGHDALMGFYFNGSQWCVSMYHANHRQDLDLSKIASKYGGGGHKGACGFQVGTLPQAFTQ